MVRVSIWKHLADVAERSGTKERIGNRVRDGITVGMTCEREVDRNRNATKDQRAAGREAVRVVSYSNA